MNRLIASFNLLEWDSTLISISFLIAALVAGIAFYLVLSFILSRLGPEVWQDTRKIQTFDTAASCYRNVFTGEILNLDQQEAGLSLALQDILSVYPVALLERIDNSSETS